MAQIDYYILIVLTLAIAYTLIFGYCMYKTNKFGYFNDDWKHTKIFYFSVIIQTFIRMTTYALLTFAVTKAQRSHSFILVIRSVPGTLFLINYILLVYQTVNIFYHSHMENRLHVSLLKHFTRPKFGTARKLMSFISIIWLCYMGVIYALLLLNKITGTYVELQFAIVNLLSGTLVLLYLMYLYSKYSETPFKSLQDKANLQIVSRVLMTWTLGRYLQGFLGLVDFESAYFFNYLSNPQQTNLGSSILFVMENLICDILCFYIVMDYRFINIFISQDVENMKKFEEIEETQNIIVTSETSPLFIQKNSITLKNPFKKRRHGLGELFFCKINETDALCRKVSISQASDFVEEIKKEVEELRSKNIAGLSHFYAACLDLPVINLVFQAPGKSLFKAFHEEKAIICLKEKMKILKEVALTMKTLHEKKSFHGHLSSHNVILQESHCLVSDLGLFNIKKHASVKDGYGNKGFWTSPEQWLENDRAVVNPAASDDVYSFGILLWEVLTGDMPFESLRGSEMRTEIGVNKKTPRVPGYFPKQIRKLLEICWSPVETRGTMDAVQQKLLSLRFEVIAE